jgi:hypothetical protein
VCDRLASAAGEIHVPEGFVVQEPEVLPAFGADVDVPCGGERRGRDPEEFLEEDPLVDLLFSVLLVRGIEKSWDWIMIDVLRTFSGMTS